MAENYIGAALIRLSTAPSSLLGALQEGSRLTQVTQMSIEDLRNQVCTDRINLASHFIATGDRLLSDSSPDFRSAISRFYYGMYQSMRAVVYLTNDGDEHEAHSELPKHVPNNFRDAAVWRNALKDARQWRNDADYDPYPTNQDQFSDTAYELQTNARRLLTISRGYLRARGCSQL